MTRILGNRDIVQATYQNTGSANKFMLFDASGNGFGAMVDQFGALLTTGSINVGPVSVESVFVSSGNVTLTAGANLIGSVIIADGNGSITVDQGTSPWVVTGSLEVSDIRIDSVFVSSGNIALSAGTNMIGSVVIIDGGNVITVDQTAGPWSVFLTDDIEQTISTSVDGGGTFRAIDVSVKTGSLLAFQGTSPWVVTGSLEVSDIHVDSVYIPSGNVTLNVGTNLIGSVIIADGNGSITVDGSVSSTQGTSPWVVIGSTLVTQGTSPWVVTGSLEVSDISVDSVYVSSGNITLSAGTNNIGSVVISDGGGSITVDQATGVFSMSGLVGEISYFPGQVSSVWVTTDGQRLTTDVTPTARPLAMIAVSGPVEIFIGNSGVTTSVGWPLGVGETVGLAWCTGLWARTGTGSSDVRVWY